MTDLEIYYRLGVALALGLLVGLERGWHGREQEEGERVAGLRTFALIGLLGGVMALLAQELGPVVLAVAFAALSVLLLGAYAISQRQVPSVGITGVVAALLTFSFGAMAVQGEVIPATAAAVVTTMLLSTKPLLHAWVRRLQEHELSATLKLLLVSVVMLPLLPDQGYGPYEALNPLRIWWMVVLITGISYVGYFAMKIIGEHKGILATGLFGGLANSTMLTVKLSRLARRERSPTDVLAAAILLASATMFPRILAISAIVKWSLAMALAWPLAIMTVVNSVAAWIFWRRGGMHPEGGDAEFSNPFELRPALIFATLLAVVMMLSRFLFHLFGERGIYLLGASSGLLDVNAIALSLADLAGNSLGVPAAALAILMAAFANTLGKAGVAFILGGRALGIRVAAGALAVVAAGLAGWWLMA